MMLNLVLKNYILTVIQHRNRRHEKNHKRILNNQVVTLIKTNKHTVVKRNSSNLKELIEEIAVSVLSLKTSLQVWNAV